MRDTIREVAIARLFIEKRNESSAQIEADARAERDEVKVRSQKLVLLRQFEDQLRAAIDDARANELSEVNAVMDMIERPENAHIFHLFQGYDQNGAPDGIADAELQRRLEQILTLYTRLKQQRYEAIIISAADSYAGALDAFLADYAVDPEFAGYAPAAEEYISEYKPFQAATVRNAVSAINDDENFRANVWAWMQTLNADQTTETRLYRTALVQLLHSTAPDAPDLKTQMLAAIDAMEADILSGYQALTEEPTRRMQRDRDLSVETSVSDLIAAYAQRATKARPGLQSFIDAIDGGASINAIRAQLYADVDDALKNAYGTVPPPDSVPPALNGMRE
ncbi:MAG: hypothetical protein KDK34_14520, partial [Leptospiraceae bacterium]|nr:hypothetical protein [Leptospiraceae bacterium]